jgi:hypothetical protein
MGDGKIEAIGFGIVFLLACIYFGYALVGSSDEITITVEEKWVKAQDGGSMKYLFSDTKGNVYSVEDSWCKWTFDASDRFAKLEKGKTYRIETFGRRMRLPIRSNYPNAIRIEEV